MDPQDTQNQPGGQSPQDEPREKDVLGSQGAVTPPIFSGGVQKDTPVPESADPPTIDPSILEAGGEGTPPAKSDSFVMSFARKKKIDASKLIPVILALFLIALLPLAVFSVRRRHTRDSEAQLQADECLCESITVSKEWNSIHVGDEVTFTGFGSINYEGSIDKIRLTINKGEEVVRQEEGDASLDQESEGWKFYRVDFNSYLVEEEGDYEAAIQVHCPDGWKD